MPSRGAAIVTTALACVCATGLVRAADGGPNRGAASTSLIPSSKAGAVETYLKHAYSVYFGLRACTELSAERNDRSFLPTVTLEESRRTLRSIDAAAAEVRIDSDAAWAAAAPRAEVTAEALKAEPSKHVQHCQQLGHLFRIDVSNLQALLQSLGAKTTLISKDY